MSNLFKIALIIPLCMLYPYMFGKLADVISPPPKEKSFDFTWSYDDTSFDTKLKPLTDEEKAQRKKKNEERRIAEEKNATTKFITLMIAGTVAVMSGLYLKNAPINLAMVIAGIICIAYATTEIWRYKDDKMKLLISAIDFAALFIVVNSYLTSNPYITSGGE